MQCLISATKPPSIRFHRGRSESRKRTFGTGFALEANRPSTLAATDMRQNPAIISIEANLWIDAALTD